MLDPKSPGICTFDSTIFYHMTKDTNEQNALSIQNPCNCFVNPRADLFTCSFRLKNQIKGRSWGSVYTVTSSPPLSSLRERTGHFIIVISSPESS